MTFEARKREELRAKLDGFTQEMKNWQELAGKTSPLKKHHTQVEYLTRALAALARQIDGDLLAVPDLRRQWPELERQVLALHTAWGFYRDKWALRRIDGFRQYLILADEFAWECYRPALKAFGDAQDHAPAQRVPPLVFLGAVHGPWSLARGDSGQEEVDDDLVKDTVVYELVRELPLPVVAMPWHELSHLPQTVVLGHEVGHLVLVDFVGLDTVESLIDEALVSSGAVQDERAPWTQWAEEAFADVYGTLSGGPAYAQTLGDVLIARDIERQPPNEYYPPPLLRLGIVAGALEEAMSSEAAQHLLASWQDDGVDVAAAPHHPVAMTIGRALVCGHYPALGGSLGSVIAPLSLANLSRKSSSLLNRIKFTTDFRQLVAATVTAFRSDPERFSSADVRAHILATAESNQTRGFRAVTSETVEGAAEENFEPTADQLARMWKVLSESSSPRPPNAVARA